MSTLPRISVITPSYNQAEYLEKTLHSVLAQNYPNIEYIVIDGGSTDGSPEIIKRYESHLAYWTSEKDRGQTHAINKGLEKATGDILAYINSDDFYLPDCLHRVAAAFAGDPQLDLVHGRCQLVDVAGNRVGAHCGSIDSYDQILDLWGVWWNRRQFIQPEVFWSRRITERVGLMREELMFVMDYDYWARILRAGGKVGKLDVELASFRFTPQQKTKRVGEVRAELLRVNRELLWDADAPIRYSRRCELQGQWLFDSVFRTESARSLAAGEPRHVRWLRLLMLTLRHPKMLCAPGFQGHIRSNMFTFGHAAT